MQIHEYVSEAHAALRKTGLWVRARFDTWQGQRGYSTGEAVARLVGYTALIVVLAPLAVWLTVQIVSILVNFVDWVFSDQPEPTPDPPSAVEQSIDRAVPALASMVTGAVVHWFREHTQGLALTARDLGLIWGSFASLITLGALARIRGAQLGYVGVAAATTWIAWQGADGQTRLVVAGSVALLFAVAGMLAGGRVRTRIRNWIDARPREKSVSELDRERDNAAELKQMTAAVDRIANSNVAPDTPAQSYTADELDEGGAVANKLGLDSTLLPSEMAGLLRTARKAG